MGRLENGETFVITEKREKPRFYVRQKDWEAGLYKKDRSGFRGVKSDYRTLDGELLYVLTFAGRWDQKQWRRKLEDLEIRTYEGDLSFADQYCLSRQIHSSVLIEGPWRKGKFVDRVYVNSEIKRAEYFPKLVLLALDIETDVKSGSILAISLAGKDPYGKREIETVLLLGESPDRPWIENFESERELLKAFSKRVSAFDPDIITGWNIVDFDFTIIAGRFQAHGLPMDFSRSSKEASFLPSTERSKTRIIIPGRQVIDSLWLMRASPDRFEDYSLETVAGTLLGKGKEVHSSGEEKLAELERLYRQDPVGFAHYCLEDSRLVLEILEKTELMELTVKRCLLTGIDLDRAWTSIRPFEYLYMEALHKQGIIAPTLGVDAAPVLGAAGGLLISPDPGLTDNVFIFDFKSLYPSIIRTFNIDPAAFVLLDPDYRRNKNSIDYIKAPNGACFSRKRGILPVFIDEFFENRERAKREGDRIASYVYKILMNSFYGVLGTPGCRFASSLFAGAITGFGQKLLLWCRDLLEGEGFSVLYGDTDSLFVKSKLPRESGYGSLRKEGEEVALLVNRQLEHYVKEEYGLVSRLELEFEKIYRRLFIPPIRGAGKAEEGAAKGRTKGYAGYILSSKKPKNPADLIEIKGMEAVRSDWTLLAHRFQERLLLMIFTGASRHAIESCIRQVQKELLDGKLDDQLVYHKNLRRNVSDYTKTKPPHVKAASLLGWTDRRGKIAYYITTNGPEPVQKHSSPLDYNHYIEKQLKPIAGAFEGIHSLDIEFLFDNSGQPRLF